MINLEEEAHLFLEKMFAEIDNTNLDYNDWFIDHLCYRTVSQEEYENLKTFLKTKGSLLVESEVGGRLIASFQLNNSINYKHFDIPLIELPAPKKGSNYQAGFEHFEFVISENFESLMEQYPEFSFNKKAITKSINPDIQLQFQNGSVKFHHQSLSEIIQQELSGN